MSYKNSEGYDDPTAGEAFRAIRDLEKRQARERLRDLTWDDYGISRERYQELKHFCLQYKAKRAETDSLTDASAPAIRYDKIGSGGGFGGSPTETAAIRHAMRTEKARHDCRIIEESAMWAAAAAGYRHIWKALLVSVSEGLSYTQTMRRCGLPFGSTDFYGIRRAFFYRLDVLQTENEKVG